MASSSIMRPVTILKSVFIALYAFSVLFTVTEACDGYKIKVNKLQPCDSSGIFKLTNPKVELTKECRITTDGCLEITKDFSSCKLLYNIKKKGMIVPFRGEKDVCDEMAKMSKHRKQQKSLRNTTLARVAQLNKTKCAHRKMIH